MDVDFYNSFTLYGRRPSYTMERGIAVLLNRIMTSLIYRGKSYTQNNSNFQNSFVELTYRRSVYTNRRQEASSKQNLVTLKYRGIEYER